MIISLPKLVKKAKQWIVTIKTIGDKGQEKFEQHWFNTQPEAQKFYQDKQNETSKTA